MSKEERDPAGRDFRTSVWVNSTYFAEGFPYWIVRSMTTIFFTDIGLREMYLGFLNFLGIPWNLKLFWAPLVDFYGTKRRWLLAIEIALTGCIALVALLVFLHFHLRPWPAWLPTALGAILFLVTVLAFLSATHDIAIDGYYLAAITDRDHQALYTGDRTMAYRIAVIFVKSALVATAAALGWAVSWVFAALTMGLLLVFHSWYLPQPESAAPRARGPMLRHFAESFRTYMDQPRIALMLSFILIYKLGDQILISMNTPFLLRELQLTKVQLSWLSGILGTIGSISGSILGAYWISKAGLKRAIWPLTLLMNLSILAYVALAYWKPSATTPGGLAWIAAIDTGEHWADGLGSSSLMVYLMRTCKPEFKAGHFAVGSAIMTLVGMLLGGFGGAIVEHYGYVGLYLIGFLASIPSMALIPWIPHLDAPRRPA